MSTATQRNPINALATPPRVGPSLVGPVCDSPFSLEQELEPFGSWVSESMWVPPKDSSSEFAQSMLSDHGLLSSKSESWTDLVEKHRSTFQQVREIDLSKASIRLPKAFVAEMPGSNGMVLRIGHFDEVGGVTHIEI